MRPKVAIVCGYFDWFSGYQEVALAKGLTEFADVTAFAGDLVNPIFSDDHLANIGVPRRYTDLDEVQFDVRVRRIPVRELRSMVVGRGLARAVAEEGVDLAIQVMPGFVLPAAASFAEISAPRVVLYGDNSAMYANLKPIIAQLKYFVFAATKGSLYRVVNSRAERIYGYTPETLERLRFADGSSPMQLLPLVYDGHTFYWDEEDRVAMRAELGVADDEKLVIGIGKINQQKRYDLLVESFETLAVTNVKLRLAILGLSNERASDDLRARVERSRFRDRITLLPFGGQNRLRAFFNAADLGVWPRMPAVTIQQAMGTGLRVALPRSPTVSHLIADGHSGTYFDVRGEGSADMTAAIRRLLDDDSNERDRIVRANEWLSARSVSASLLEAHVPRWESGSASASL